MKRARDLWPALVSFENLLLAARKAERGKRYRPEVARFNLELEANLLRLQAELEGGDYQPGPYRTWTIYERKARRICAAPYRDRVVHHALCNVIQPLFERGFIADSYACRAGKGTHAALRRATQYLRRYAYVLQLDVRRYFPTIDQAILTGQLARRIADGRVMDLIGRILATYESDEPVVWFPGDDLLSAPSRRRGLPLGNQTSQFFANVYLDGLDHLIKEGLRCPGYVRYVDDLALFADSKPALWAMLEAVQAQVTALRLRLHPAPRLAPRGEGLTWVGYRVLPDRVRLAAANPHRFRRRLRGLVLACRAGELPREAFAAHWDAWSGHAGHANAAELRRAVRWRAMA